MDPEGKRDARQARREDGPDPLSVIMERLTKRLGLDLGADEVASLQVVEGDLARNPALANSLRVNPPENGRPRFDQTATDRLQELAESKFRLDKRLDRDPEFEQAVFNVPFERVLGVVLEQPGHRTVG